MIEKEQIFKHLEYMAEKMPCNLYWLDLDQKIVGINKKTLESIGAIDKKSILEKTVYHIYPKDIADDLTNHFNKVLANLIDIREEHTIKDLTTGKRRTYVDTVSPILNSKDEPIGIVGTSIEITAEKERAQEDAKFYSVVQQVVHDIRSPAATMQMILPHCNIHPENARVTLNQSAIRIQDIANQLLNRFKPQNSLSDSTTDNIHLISSSILEIISEKRFEYELLPIDFNAKINTDSCFAFADINPTSLKRMLSNLINNSVDSFNGSIGEITIHLDVTSKNQIKITVEDNGCGMTDTVKNSIINNLSFTTNESSGHGIGLSQVRETIKSNNGTFDIQSKLGSGTQFIIFLPKALSPDWISDRIELNKNDIIVILDDDPSIHGAWDSKLKSLIQKITCVHFEQASDTIKYIKNLSENEKNRVLLLTDYELLEQNTNGLEVIEETNIYRSILVTSHYNNKSIQASAKKLNTRILPKPLASEVSIVISQPDDNIKNTGKSFNQIAPKKVDMVFIDDDVELVENFMCYVLKNKNIDIYHSGENFLEFSTIYDLNTIFLIDLQFDDEQIDGITIAKHLYELGYRNLYLFSGWEIDSKSIPEYIKIIPKTEFNTIINLLK